MILRKFIPAALFAFAALALSGCGAKHEAVRRCVDEDGNKVEDRNCTNPPPGSTHKYAWVYAPSPGKEED